MDIRLMVATGKGRERGKDWEFRVGRCKQLHLEWINSKVLMHSEGNFVFKYFKRIYI